MSRERLDVDVFFVTDGEEVTAVFAGTVGEEREGEFTVYKSPEQHGTATPAWVSSCRPAGAEEYAEVLSEMHHHGYDVTVVEQSAGLCR